MGEVILGLLLGGFLLLLLIGFLRLLLSVVGLGRWACRKGWHWFKDFPLHSRQTFTGRTTTYLAVAGIKINRCRTCGLFAPLEGQVVYDEWQRGGIKTVGGGLFSSPNLKADATAVHAIASALAPARAEAERLRRKKGPPPRWMVIAGSTAIVQQLGRYVMVVAMIAGGLCLISSLAEALDKRSTASDALGLFLLGGALLAVTFGIASLTDAGMARYISRQQADEAARDPVGFYNKSIEVARKHGVEIPASVTPEMLVEIHRKKADEA